MPKHRLHEVDTDALARKCAFHKNTAHNSATKEVRESCGTRQSFAHDRDDSRDATSINHPIVRSTVTRFYSAVRVVLVPDVRDILINIRS